MNNIAERSGRRGFSLIECLVAISLAAVSLLTIFELFPIGFVASSKTSSRAFATALCTEIISTIRRELTKQPANQAFAQYSASNNNVYDEQTNTSLSATSGFSNEYGNPLHLNSFVVNDPNITQINLNQFYWKAIFHEVIDPYMKVHPTINGGMVGAGIGGGISQLLRLTVFVHGPFTNAADEQNYASASAYARVPNGEVVEVRMQTFLSNPKLGESVMLARPINNTQVTYVPPFYVTTFFTSWVGAFPGDINVTVGDMTGFSVYNAQILSPEEQDDTGPFMPFPNTRTWGNGYGNNSYINSAGDGVTSPVGSVLQGIATYHVPPYGGGRNFLGMDNVYIGNDLTEIDVDKSANPGPQYVPTGETNKIIGITDNNKVVIGTGFAPVLQLLHPIRGFPFRVKAPWVDWPFTFYPGAKYGAGPPVTFTDGTAVRTLINPKY